MRLTLRRYRALAERVRSFIHQEDHRLLVKNRQYSEVAFLAGSLAAVAADEVDEP
jgi:hypothetical protein